MSWVPNTIGLIVHGRRDESPAGADCYPGMLLKNSGANVIPHNVVGGGGPLMVAREEALRGLTTTQKLASGDNIPYFRPTKGDLMLMLLQNGQNVAANASLMSAGDGTLTAALNSALYQILAASANITNTTVETAFSNGTYTVPANFLQAGDVLKVSGKAVVSAQNSTNTHQVKVYVGSTAIFDSTALAMAAGEYVEFSLNITVRSVGATGKIVVDGTFARVVGGTNSAGAVTLASTTIDTTVTEAITVKSTASAANAGNVIALQEYQVDLNRLGGWPTVQVQSTEAVDNSLGVGTSGFGSAAFIRVVVL